jgi:hypothetical protein
LFCKGLTFRFQFCGRSSCCFLGDLFPFLLFDAGLRFGFRIVGGGQDGRRRFRWWRGDDELG